MASIFGRAEEKYVITLHRSLKLEMILAKLIIVYLLCIGTHFQKNNSVYI